MCGRSAIDPKRWFDSQSQLHEAIFFLTIRVVAGYSISISSLPSVVTLDVATFNTDERNFGILSHVYVPVCIQTRTKVQILQLHGALDLTSVQRLHHTLENGLILRQ